MCVAHCSDAQGSRGSSGGNLDLALDWTVSLAGRLTSQALEATTGIEPV
jgi:hypothetical protein